MQRRTLRLLFATQIVSGIGVTIGSAVGALLAAELAGVGMSGLAQSAVVVGAALFAIPATTIVQRGGRRPSLAAGYAVATLGAGLIVLAAMTRSIPVLFAGFFFFGGATAANFQARYAAVDLAPAALRGRHLALIVWATTIGAVAGPQFAAAAGRLLAGRGVPTLASPFVFSALLFAFTAFGIMLLLRPDPVVVARQTKDQAAVRTAPGSDGILNALRVIVSLGPARLGVAAMAVGHLVMIGVMAMTPVHIRSGGLSPAETLRVVGHVLSLHIAGMYALSPVMGWLTDRLGRRPVIVAGIVFLLGACALAGAAGHHAPQIGAGLLLLGLGWSATMVAGSTLLSESIPLDLRPAAQGVSDLVMGLAGASAGAVSGVIVHARGYPTLTLLAALATAPLVLLVAMTRTGPART